jgi:hypothetical protein
MPSDKRFRNTFDDCDSGEGEETEIKSRDSIYPKS